MESIEEAKKTMYELHTTEKFEKLLKHCILLLKDVSQNLSNYDKMEILQYKEFALSLNAKTHIEKEFETPHHSGGARRGHGRIGDFLYTPRHSLRGSG